LEQIKTKMQDFADKIITIRELAELKNKPPQLPPSQ
jgi:hypothetical protein